MEKEIKIEFVLPADAWHGYSTESVWATRTRGGYWVDNIPMRGGRVADGQVVRPGIDYYMCVFLPVLDDSATITLKGLAPALCVFATEAPPDAPLRRGRWSICAKEKVHPKIPLPHFKLDYGDDRVIIVDIDEKFVRKASAAEELTLPYRTTVGQDVIINAIESLLARGTVDDDDQFMLVSFYQGAPLTRPNMTMRSAYFRISVPEDLSILADAKNEEEPPVRCPIDPDHQRAGRHLRVKSAEVATANELQDFVYTWLSYVLVSPRMAAWLRRNRCSGIHLRATELYVAKEKPRKPHRYYELTITGSDGFVRPANRVTLTDFCERCGMTEFSYNREPPWATTLRPKQRLDFFTIWPIPAIFVSERVVTGVAEMGFTGLLAKPLSQPLRKRGHILRRELSPIDPPPEWPKRVRRELLSKSIKSAQGKARKRIDKLGVKAVFGSVPWAQ